MKNNMGMIKSLNFLINMTSLQIHIFLSDKPNLSFYNYCDKAYSFIVRIEDARLRTFFTNRTSPFS